MSVVKIGSNTDSTIVPAQSQDHRKTAYHAVTAMNKVISCCKQQVVFVVKIGNNYTEPAEVFVSFFSTLATNRFRDKCTKFFKFYAVSDTGNKTHSQLKKLYLENFEHSNKSGLFPDNQLKRIKKKLQFPQ